MRYCSILSALWVFWYVVRTSDSQDGQQQPDAQKKLAGCNPDQNTQLISSLSVITQKMDNLSNLFVDNIFDLSENKTMNETIFQIWGGIHNIQMTLHNISIITAENTTVAEGALKNKTIVLARSSFDKEKQPTVHFLSISEQIHKLHAIANTTFDNENGNISGNVPYSMQKMNEGFELSVNIMYTLWKNINVVYNYLENLWGTYKARLIRHEARILNVERDNLKNEHKILNNKNKCDTTEESLNNLIKQYKDQNAALANVQEKLEILRKRSYYSAGITTDANHTLKNNASPENTVNNDDAFDEVVGHKVLDVSSEVTRLELRLQVLEQRLDKHMVNVGQVSNITRETCNGERRHLVGNSCYYVPPMAYSEHLYTWWDARYLCKKHEVLGPRADLVSIETKQEMDSLQHLLLNHFGGIEEFWVGGNDLVEEGTWTWIGTGKSISKQSFSNWGHKPTHSTAQNCLAMLQGYLWADEPCYYEKYPICELNLHDVYHNT